LDFATFVDAVASVGIACDPDIEVLVLAPELVNCESDFFKGKKCAGKLFARNINKSTVCRKTIGDAFE
jgi:hypothetical protein